MGSKEDENAPSLRVELGTTSKTALRSCAICFIDYGVGEDVVWVSNRGWSHKLCEPETEEEPEEGPRRWSV